MTLGATADTSGGMVGALLGVAAVLAAGWGVQRFVTRQGGKGGSPPPTAKEPSLEEARAASEKIMDAEDERFLQDLVAGEQKRAEGKRAFLQSAKVVRGTVLSTRTVGEYNHKPMLRISVKVDAPEGSYTVDTKMAVEQTWIPRFTDGSTLDVYVDPNDPQRIHFGEGTDWVEM